MAGYLGDKFTERLRTDYRVFDGRQSLVYVSISGNVTRTRGGQISNEETEITIIDALCREITRRDQQLLKQLFDKFRSINISDINIGDVYIEIPYVQMVDEEGNEIRPKNGDKIKATIGYQEGVWSVVGFDHATLLSRWRVIVRKV